MTGAASLKKWSDTCSIVITFHGGDGRIKVDHLIPAELGGADTIDNLWPQSLYTKPYNAQRKELLTQRLLALVGLHEMTLAQARKRK